MLVGVKEMAKRLNVSRVTVFELMKEGMPTIRISERIIRFDPDEVMQWVKNKAS
jgi:excisionase family DNA binding protein